MLGFRVGQGYDAHALVENRKLILGGVDIPFEKGLLGHSDADVLIHAIMDALLGAVAEGDIGKMFPDTSEEFYGISSIDLLERVEGFLSSRGYEIVNIDSTVILQRPKIAPYISDMRSNIARALKIDPCSVSVKATTEEHMGYTGRGEGIKALAIALVVKKL
jgi:2-C-methyl-D-erythritol 2,4-cyclodiphosphate synthase